MWHNKYNNFGGLTPFYAGITQNMEQATKRELANLWQ